MGSMAADHYTFSGQGIVGEVDLSNDGTDPDATLSVDGLRVDACVEVTTSGFDLRGIVRRVPDREIVQVVVHLPDVNVSREPTVFAGIATLTTSYTSVGGQSLVEGPLELYEIRPLSGQASRSER